MSNDLNLPWKYREFHRGYGVVFDSAGSVILYPTPELAAHIVKCVNAHDGLVEALKVAIERDETGVTMTSGQMQDARAALAAATGGKDE